MADYGVTPEGFRRKPLSRIKADIESRLISEFGSGLILSPQSPMGQIVGLFADYAAEIWEEVEAVYQSHDVDQAEGTQLDILGKLRNVRRTETRSDEEMRAAITNAGVGVVDVQDIENALHQIDGVTFAEVYVNSGTDFDSRGIPGGNVAAVVEGGADADVGGVLRSYVAPGVSLYGTSMVDAMANGRCWSIPLVRPIRVEVDLSLTVRTKRDEANCPPPSIPTIRNLLATGWEATRRNGKEVSPYTIRQIIEVFGSSVELMEARADRVEGEESAYNSPLPVNFIEIADLRNISISEWQPATGGADDA